MPKRVGKPSLLVGSPGPLVILDAVLV